MLIILHLNLKKHHIFLDGLLLDIKQWGFSAILPNQNAVSVMLPIAINTKLFITAIDMVNTNNPVTFGYYLDEEDNNKIIKFVTEKTTPSESNNTFLWFGLFS